MALSRYWKEYKWIWLGFALAGLVFGLAGYTIYVSRAWSYVNDDPATCVNCHIMGSYYQSWDKSSHRQWATCNDCHVPQDNILREYGFKAVDGLYHAAVYTAFAEPQAIRAKESSKEVIIENCLRCHYQLVTELIKMTPDYQTVTSGEKKACWDCHQDLVHTRISSLGADNGANLPLLPAPVPGWLERMISN